MRLQHYITEAAMSDRTKGQLKDYIEKNCKQFLKEFGVRYVHLSFIYRGMKTRNIKQFSIIKARTDRKPRYIEEDLHKYLCKISKELFGWNARTEGVFTGSANITNAYGQRDIFIPIGKYKYVYNTDVSEIYGLYDDYDYLNDKNEPYWKDEQEKRDKLLKLIYNEYIYLHQFRRPRR